MPLVAGASLLLFSASSSSRTDGVVRMDEVGEDTAEGSSGFRGGRAEETSGGIESVMKPRSIAWSMDDGGN